MVAMTLATAVHHEVVIRRSRFLCRVEPVEDRAAARARVAQLRAEHPGARHVCWAFHAGGQSAASDDGEPSGTAGQPMLRVLQHHRLEGVVASVVRYFGGTKLGAGGLVRAYTAAVAGALCDARTTALQAVRSCGCVVPYALEGPLRRALEAHGVEIVAIDHGEEVAVRFIVAADLAEALVRRVDELTQGRACWG